MKIFIIHDPDQLEKRGNQTGNINSYHRLVTTSISTALNQLGHKVEIFEADSYLEYNLTHCKPDLVFNTSIRSYRNSIYAYAPEILERLKIPFTGPSAISCNNAFDKQKSLTILRKANLITPKSITFDKSKEIFLPEFFEYPLFVKPQRGGCSWGITEHSIINSKFNSG